MERELKDCRIIGIRRDNTGKHSNIYMIRECIHCHAILEFPSNEVSDEITEKGDYIEYIKCPNCGKKVFVV